MFFLGNLSVSVSAYGYVSLTVKEASQKFLYDSVV